MLVLVFGFYHHITFSIDDGSEMGSFHGPFYIKKYGKIVASLLNESLEWNDGYLLDLSDISIVANVWVVSQTF